MTRSRTRTSRDLTADYIVVGAGSAGAALAARLTEDPAVSVLLLEAGAPDKALELHVPAAFSKLFRGEYDWNYDTVPQPALENRTIFWPRGKTLGGSSSINGMIYMRGQVSDYDGWAAATGDDTWRWEHVLPAFKRHEDHYLGADEMHGAGGEWRVRRVQPRGRPSMRSAITFSWISRVPPPITIAGTNISLVTTSAGANRRLASDPIRSSDTAAPLRLSSADATFTTEAPGLNRSPLS